jgi:predicted RecB family nuclease
VEGKMRAMRRQDGRLTLSPSDVNAFLACPHLTSLELAVAREQLERPFRANPYAELIRRKGDQHEAAYLASLRQGVTKIGDPHEIGWDLAAAATERAIRDQARFIYQAALVDRNWHGLADFLELQPDGSYEVVDTKLARRAKPAHLLQLCFYTEQLARIQNQWPVQMHVVNGLGERESFKPQDFLAYYRRLKARFLDRVCCEAQAMRMLLYVHVGAACAHPARRDSIPARRGSGSRAQDLSRCGHP